MTVRINLAPGERKPTRKRRERTLPSIPSAVPSWLPSSPGVLVGLAGLLVLLLAVFFYFGERSAVEEARVAIEEAQADSARLHNQVIRVQSMEAAQEDLAARVDMMESVVEGRLYWIRFMEGISGTLPPYTWLETIDRADLGADQVRIAGATFSNAAVTEYMRGLEASPLLRGVTLVGVSRTQQDSIQYQSFTLVADLEDYDTVVIESETNEEGGQ